MSVIDSPQALLKKALAQAEIPYLLDGPKHTLFTSVYWKENSLGDIEIVLSTWHFNCGKLETTIRLTDLARFIQQTCADDDHLTALVDALEYIKAVVFCLLSITQGKLITRAQNTRYRDISPDDKTAVSSLFEMTQAAFIDARATMEARLEMRPQRRRGGSKPKLSSSLRSSLHAEYDQLHRFAIAVKKDYNAELKAFTKAHQKRGFSRDQWVAHWKQFSKKNYSGMVQELLALFAADDNPSAGSVAHAFLAKLYGHEVSYLPKLIRESRKKSLQSKA